MAAVAAGTLGRTAARTQTFEAPTLIPSLGTGWGTVRWFSRRDRCFSRQHRLGRTGGRLPVALVQPVRSGTRLAVGHELHAAEHWFSHAPRRCIVNSGRGVAGTSLFARASGSPRSHKQRANGMPETYPAAKRLRASRADP